MRFFIFSTLICLFATMAPSAAAWHFDVGGGWFGCYDSLDLNKRLECESGGVYPSSLRCETKGPVRIRASQMLDDLINRKLATWEGHLTKSCERLDGNSLFHYYKVEAIRYSFKVRFELAPLHGNDIVQTVCVKYTNGQRDGREEFGCQPLSYPYKK